jgi:hypothetical protein
VLLALRAEEVATARALAPWLGGLEREAATTRLELERLTPQDVVQLVAALAGDAPERERRGAHHAGAEEVSALGQWLAGQTGGQPLGVTQMLQALLEEGALRWRPVAGAGWGLDVGDAVPTGAAGSAPTLSRQERWAEGCRDAAALPQDLLARRSWLRAQGPADGGGRVA